MNGPHFPPDHDLQPGGKVQEELVPVLRFGLEDFYFISLCKNTIRDLLNRSLSTHNSVLFSIDTMLCSDSLEIIYLA